MQKFNQNLRWGDLKNLYAGHFFCKILTVFYWNKSLRSTIRQSGEFPSMLVTFSAINSVLLRNFIWGLPSGGLENYFVCWSLFSAINSSTQLFYPDLPSEVSYTGLVREIVLHLSSQIVLFSQQLLLSRKRRLSLWKILSNRESRTRQVIASS